MISNLIGKPVPIVIGNHKAVVCTGEAEALTADGHQKALCVMIYSAAQEKALLALQKTDPANYEILRHRMPVYSLIFETDTAPVEFIAAILQRIIGLDAPQRTTTKTQHEAVVNKIHALLVELKEMDTKPNEVPDAGAIETGDSSPGPG